MTTEIRTEPLSASAFAEFGDVLEARGSPDNIINQGNCGRYNDLALMEMLPGGRTGISIFDAKPRSLPYVCDMLERHPFGAQAFIPMHSNPYLVIVAPSAGGKPATPRAFIAGPGRGFEIAKGRLGPGRVHHCMRAIGAAERTLELMIKRAATREAFGRPLAKLGGNPDIIANARMAIEQARLLTLKCAWALDTKGVAGALQEVSMIKAVVPSMLQKIVDDAIQIHGGAGVSDDDFPLTALYGYARVLRLADGPDEVHRAMVARLELRKYQNRKQQ